MKLRTLHHSLTVQEARFSAWLASPSVQSRLPQFAYYAGAASLIYAIVFAFQPGSLVYIPDPELIGNRWLLLIPAVIAAVSYPMQRFAVTKLWARVLVAFGLILTTAALVNSFIDWLHAAHYDDTDTWYFASSIERFSSRSYLYYTLGGAAFLLAVELRDRPTHDERLRPTARPRPLAWLLAILTAAAIAFGASGLLMSLQEAKGQQVDLVTTMIVTAALGVIALLSSVPALQRLGRLSIGFAAVVASTAWGLLVGLLYSQRVPDLARSDTANHSLTFKADQPDSMIRVIGTVRDGYSLFLLAIGLALFFIWVRNKLRRDQQPNSITNLAGSSDEPRGLNP